MSGTPACSGGNLVTDLAAQQAALEHHFGELASKRAGAPVFAFEHGLHHTERFQIQRQLKAYCARRKPSDEHWLLWTIYSSELGYEYAGREYWQTFEKE